MVTVDRVLPWRREPSAREPALQHDTDFVKGVARNLVIQLLVNLGARHFERHFYY